MKKCIIALSLIIFSTQSPIFSMDPSTQTKKQLENSTASEITEKIICIFNATYYSNGYGALLNDFTLGWGESSDDMLKVLNITAQNCPEDIIDIVCDRLLEQTTLFRRALQYFLFYASKNLNTVTAQNLTTISDPTKKQPIDELNNLPLAIKRYVMAKAFENIEYTHDIVLRHKQPVRAFDIYEHEDLAATCSYDNDYKNSLFLVWSLKTGKPIYDLHEPEALHLVSFDPKGSYLAGSFVNKNAVKVWCMKTKQALYEFNSVHGIGTISFSYPTGSILSASSIARSQDPCNALLTQWQIAPTQTGECINRCNIFEARDTDSAFYGKKYTAFSARYNLIKKNELSITNKNCSSLYLCMEARKKMNCPSMQQVETLALFHKLTDVQKEIVRTRK